jgi:hypothetical protein
VRRVPGVTRRLLAAFCALLLGFQTGCYTLGPVQSAVPVGAEQVGVLLNDRGRFQMSESLGTEVDLVIGALMEQDDAKIRLAVYRVVTLRGAEATWTGESIEIPRDGIMGFRERKLSKARSWVLAGAVVGAIIISVLVLDLDLFGDPADELPCTGPSCGENPSIRR